MQWNSALDDCQILGVMSDEGRRLYRGLYWGEQTRHGVLDIDAGSKYHNAQELCELVRKFAAAGLPLVPYQSSDSGGWHLYFFLEDWAESSEVEKTLRAYLKAHSYSITGGTLEVFPSGNALRLPLQKGFAWLSSEGEKQITRDELTFGQALALFFNDMEDNRVNWSEAKNRIESQIANLSPAGDAGAGEIAQGVQDPEIEPDFEKLFLKGIDWERYRRGQEYWQNGLTEPSQRHDAILSIGHYLWYGDEAAGLMPLPYQKNRKRRYELIYRWLEEKHNGQSEDVKKGRWTEVTADIERATSWSREASQTAPAYEPYRLTERLLERLAWLYNKTGKLWTVEELAQANIERGQDARHRIAVAVAQLETEGQLISKASVARRAKSSRNTVVKNLDLLTRCSGELVAGGLGGFQSGSLQLGSEKEIQDSVSSVLQFPGETLPLAVGSEGFTVFRDQVVKEPSVISGDKGQAFKLLGDFEVTPLFSVEGQFPDSEPGKSLHGSSLSLVCENAVTLGAGRSNLACVAGDPGRPPLHHAAFPAKTGEETLETSISCPLAVAPSVSCLANSQPESTQYQAQALRVAAQSLTPGPLLSGIQALRHATEGGIFQCFGQRAGSDSRGPPQRLD